MTDTPVKRIFKTITNGFQNTYCTRHFNYTNEYWYNFKSYFCGSHVSFTLCKTCNNYKRTKDQKNIDYSSPSQVRHICKCYPTSISIDNNSFLSSIEEAEEELDLEFDDFDAVFVDLMTDFHSNKFFSNSNLKRSIIIE